MGKRNAKDFSPLGGPFGALLVVRSSFCLSICLFCFASSRAINYFALFAIFQSAAACVCVLESVYVVALSELQSGIFHTQTHTNMQNTAEYCK